MANHKRKEPVVRITVGLNLTDHTQLLRIAEEAGVSLSWIVRRAAQEFLTKDKKVKPTKKFASEIRAPMRASK